MAATEGPHAPPAELGVLRAERQSDSKKAADDTIDAAKKAVK